MGAGEGIPALQLVFFVLIVQGTLTLIENTVFKYRAVSERAI